MRGVKRGRKSNAERERIRLVAAKAERKKQRYTERRTAGEVYFRRWIPCADKDLINMFCQLISLLTEQQKRVCAEGIDEQINRIRSR